MVEQLIDHGVVCHLHLKGGWFRYRVLGLFGFVDRPNPCHRILSHPGHALSSTGIESFTSVAMVRMLILRPHLHWPTLVANTRTAITLC
jgi:hypothetical protein